jgi:hypothetical protein
MPLAAILGLCLLLPLSRAEIAPSTPALGVEQTTQTTQSQKNDSSDSPSQNAAGQPTGDQQKALDQSAQSPQPLTTPRCPDKSQPTSGTKSDCKPSESNAANTKKHHRTHKTAAPAVSGSEGPTKTVVRNGGAADPTVDLSPAPGPQEASRLEAYNHLLAATDANLQKISSRQLSASQQDTVKQIKSYMEQAKSAAKDGDVQRAYNLAVKANLLSAELAGP